MSVTEEKSKSFAIRIVRLYQYLKDEKNEYVLSKQLLRSGTSVGANLSEAKYAISRNDFIAKQYIALKEVSETLYWLELLFKTDYLTQEQYDSIYQDAEELRKLLSSSALLFTAPCSTLCTIRKMSSITPRIARKPFRFIERYIPVFPPLPLSYTFRLFCRFFLLMQAV